MITTVTATIMDGTTVRWYSGEAAESRRKPTVTASRHGVHVEGWLHDIPAGLLQTAADVHANLSADRNYDASHLATHTRRGHGGVLEPVADPRDDAKAAAR